jgi:predicted nucleotidyltransferase
METLGYAAIPNFAQAVEYLHSLKNVGSIRVFGSRANGTARADSDLDLCVVFRELDRRPVLVYDKGDFIARKDSGAGLESSIELDGVPV